MKIEILGMGCPKCQKLADNAAEAANAMGLEYTLEKVTDMKDIMKYGVMMTPALVLDGKVKVSGKVPSVEELKSILT